MVTDRTPNPIVSALEKRRKSMSMTWADLARESGLGYNTWRKVVDGRSDPTISTVSAVAEALGCSVKLKVPPNDDRPSGGK